MKPLFLITLLKFAILCLPASAQTFDVDLRVTGKVTIAGTDIPKPGKRKIVQIHTLLVNPNIEERLQGAIDAARADYTARFLYITIPHYQYSDSEILQDYAWLTETATRLGMPADLLWDSENWEEQYANTIGWPPLEDWRNNDIANRATALPSSADKYTLEYSQICYNYFAEVNDRIERTRPGNIPDTARVGMYQECQSLQNHITPEYDREAQFRDEVCGYLSEDGQYKSLLRANDFMYLATHQLNNDIGSGGMSEASWRVNKVDVIPIMRKNGWSKTLGGGVEIRMALGPNAGVAQNYATMLDKFETIAAAGADEIYLVAFDVPSTIMIGTPNITISSGVATLSVAQGTGDNAIVPGVRITYGGNTAYVSAVNSSTSFDVVTTYSAAKGVGTGTPSSNIGSTAVTDIDYVSGRDYQEGTPLGSDYDGLFDAVEQFLRQQVEQHAIFTVPQRPTLAVDVDENTTAVTTLKAKGARPFTYEITGGADSAAFSVSSGGALTFTSAPNFESPTDTGGDNTYVCEVTISNAPAADSDVVTVTATVLDVGEVAATITNPATNPYNVNVSEGTTAVVDVNATGDAPITYSKSGTDEEFFTINSSTGVLAFASAPDYDTPLDNGGNNVYEVTVTADNGAQDTVDINVTVVAAAVNPPNLAGGSPRLLGVDENELLVENSTATNGPITWSISGGVDAALFEVTSTGSGTATVTFIDPPDHENPLDSGANNVYVFDLRATNAAGFDDDTIQVIVSDIVETGECDMKSPYNATLTTNAPENITEVFWCKALVDGTVTWSITGGADAADFAIDSATGHLTFNVAPDYEAPHDSDTDNLYVVDVNCDNGTNDETATLTVRVNDLAEGILLFSDLTAGAKTGWSASEPNKGVAVTIWTYDLGTGTTRGSNYVTVCGQDLTDAGDYVEWNEPHFDTTNDPDMRNIYRTTFWINSSCTDGAGTITITVGGNESNAIPFKVLTGDIFFVDKDHEGTDAGTFENPYQTLDATRIANSDPGDIFYIKEATTPYTAYDLYISGGSGILQFYTSITTMNATEAAPCAMVSYPGEQAHFQAAPTVYPSNPASITRGFANVPTWWTIAKFRIESQYASCSLLGTGSRCVGNECTGDLIEAQAGVIGTNGSKHKVFGNVVHGGRSGSAYDHGLYASGNPSDTLGCEVAWNYMYDNNWGDGPMMVLNHQEDRIPQGLNCKMHLVHHNWINCEDFPGRAIGCFQVGWEYGNPNAEEEPETHYIFNNVTIGGDTAIYIYAGNVKVWNNSVLGSFNKGIDLGNLNVIWTDVQNNIITMASGLTFIGINSEVSDVDILTATNNLYYAGGSGSAPALDTNPVFGDPLLTDTYKLGASSPAIDAGASEPGGLIFDDFEHQPRDANIDIGAWEAQ